MSDIGMDVLLAYESGYKSGYADGLKRGNSVETNIFDIEEIHYNCTVQILKNSITGEISVGWWENEEVDE